MVDEKALEAARVAAAAQWNKQNCQSEHAIADATLRGERDDTIEVQAALSAYLQALSPGSTGEAEGCGPISDEPLEALSHARTTAANDDTSLPGTVERKRHCQRLAAMQSATAEIVKLRALLSAEGLKIGSRLTVEGGEAVVVPVEPSWQMEDAFLKASPLRVEDSFEQCYRAMLSAAGERG